MSVPKLCCESLERFVYLDERPLSTRDDLLVSLRSPVFQMFGAVTRYREREDHFWQPKIGNYVQQESNDYPRRFYIFYSIQHEWNIIIILVLYARSGMSAISPCCMSVLPALLPSSLLGRGSMGYSTSVSVVRTICVIRGVIGVIEVVWLLFGVIFMSQVGTSLLPLKPQISMRKVFTSVLVYKVLY